MGLAVVGVGLEVHANPQALAPSTSPAAAHTLRPAIGPLIGLAITERCAGLSAPGGWAQLTARPTLESASTAAVRVAIAVVIGHEKRPYSTSV